MSDIRAEYIDHMGNDLGIVNDARVSFGKRSEYEYDRINDTWYLKEADKRLIKFLARGVESKDWEGAVNELICAVDKDEIEDVLKWAKRLPEHWTPFAQTSIKLREFYPIPIARQRFKHKIGMVENEISRRYVDNGLEFYQPTWRKRAENKKQGSGEEFDPAAQAMLDDEYWWLMNKAEEMYGRFIQNGVCPEQARFLLPQSMMTEVVITGNLYSFAQAYIKRRDSHAQKEIQLLAAEWDRIIRPLFPVAWSALVD